jgi:hypothetical protein
VTGIGAEGRPARWDAGGQARWPRRLGETGEEGVALDNKRTGKVHWGLVRLLEQLAGGEREQAHELKAAAAMAGGAAGWRAEGKKGWLL